MYGKEQHLLDLPVWQRVMRITTNEKNTLRMIYQDKLKAFKEAPKFNLVKQIP